MFAKFIILWLCLFIVSFFIETVPAQPKMSAILTPDINPYIINEKTEILATKEAESIPVIKPASNPIYRKGYVGYPQQYGFA